MLQLLLSLDSSACTMYYSSIDIYAFPKAEPCKAIVTGRKRRRAAILTDTPNKIELEEEQAKQNAKNKQ